MPAFFDALSVASDDELGFGEVETIKKSETRPAPSAHSRQERGHRLHVMGEGIFQTIALPEAGEVVIGRAKDAGVRIDDPAISRQHAVLHVGASSIEIEDLGSANGTILRGVKLDPNARRVVHPGDAIEIGACSLIVERDAASNERLRRFLPHGYFEARVESECARAERCGSELAVLRLHAGGGVAGSRVQEIIAGELRSDEAAAQYSPGEYELLLVDAGVDRVRLVSEALARELGREEGAEVPRIGAAIYPRDGRTPEQLVAKACEAVRGGGVAKREKTESGVVVEAPAMVSLHRLLERIASGSISVLVLGETGVGKEVIAETIHRRSPRREKVFVRLNCAALSETLIESELFGHEKGAFTGAIAAKPGLLETAQGGTLFLDEVGELPMSTQVKLLRVLEERMVLRVGALKPRPIDVRIVSATNRNLESEIAAGRFRQDLYFRLNGISITVPPLRERTAELPSLARLFVKQVCRQDGRNVEPALSPEALERMRLYAWPGNIRELRNAIERAVLLSDGDTIRPEHLPLEKMSPSAVAAVPRASSPVLSSELQAFEREKIVAALDKCGGNQTQAAKMLGIARRTLIKRLDQYKIDRPRKDYE